MSKITRLPVSRRRPDVLRVLVCFLTLVLIGGLYVSSTRVRVVQALSITTLGTAITQNFDTLANTGTPAWTDDSTLPGWYAQFGTSATNPTAYTPSTGSSGTGALYSFGAASASDRALGSVGSSTPSDIYWALKLTNNTGSTITSLDVSYAGEQWRQGGCTPTPCTPAAQTVDFQYQVAAAGVITDANAPTAGWVDHDPLDFTSPQPGTSTAAAIDGNAAANRTALSSTITVTVNNGQEVWLRWKDINHPNNDHGLAIDDFSVTPQGGGGGGTATLNINDVTQAEGNSGTTNFNFNVSLTGGTAPAGGVTFNVDTADGTAQDGAPGGEDNDYTAVHTTGSITSGNSSTTVTVQVNGDTTTESNETFLVNITNVVNANSGDTQGLGTITNDDVGLTAIHTIQGSGNSSPFAGSAVTTSGIVTGLRSNGFFLQEPDGSVDGDPNTSEGIFVFTSSAPPAATVVGNNVQVGGTVAEFIPSSDPGTPSQTEITSPTVTINSTGNGLPAPITITAADTLVNNINNLEKYEGMRVHIDSLTAGAPTGGNVDEVNATSSSFGDFYGVITGVARPFREPGIELPYPTPTPFSGGPAPASAPTFDANPERIRVNSIGLTGSVDLQVASNAVVTGITGPLDYGFRTYTIDTDPPSVTPTPLVSGGITLIAVPVPAARELTIGSFNMQRFFDTTDDPLTSDVVLTATAFNNRLNKASLAIRNVMQSPDVIGIEEMEGGPSGSDTSILQLVANKVNADAGTPGDYQPYLFRGNDIGGINVAFLVRSSRILVNSVTQYNKGETFADPSGGTTLLNDRPPLVLRASVVQPSGATLSFSVIVNHLRSLGSVTLLTNAGAHTRVKRNLQAASLARLINEMQNGGPNGIQMLPFDQNIVSVGDYNSFQFNDGYDDVMGVVEGTPAPATQVVESSADLNNPDLTELIDTLPADQMYSYTFGGNAQALDHTVANPNMMARFSRFAYARMDADFPDSFRNDPNRPERISDHDPEVAYFNMAIVPTAANGVVSGRITDPNGVPIAGAIVTLSGTQNRKFITDANGNYRFDDVETSGFYTVRPSRANFTFSPAERSFSQLGNNTEAAFTGTPAGGFSNPLDTPEYFVRQHYLDFLGREPDESGFNFWSDQILECGSDASCIERRTINVSAAYFLSIEFQQTGGLVDGLYRASYGVQPKFTEFMPDTSTLARGVVVGRSGWEQQLAANKQAFIDEWVARPEFRAAYDLLTNDRYVDSLIAHTGVSFTQSERNTLVNGLTLGTLLRANVVQRIAEDQRVVAAKRNEAFVMMEYFGYLRRDPDQSGYQFWLNKLNQFDGNFEQAEMVKAFIVSGEYRARFR